MPAIKPPVTLVTASYLATTMTSRVHESLHSLVASSYFPNQDGQFQQQDHTCWIEKSANNRWLGLAHSSTKAGWVLGFSKLFESFNQVNFLFRQMLCSLSIFCYLDVQFIQFVTACQLFSESVQTTLCWHVGHVVTDNSHTALSAHKPNTPISQSRVVGIAVPSLLLASSFHSQCQ